MKERPTDELAAQRGKRGIITIAVGGRVIRTLQVPLAEMKNPVDAMRRRARKPKA